MHIKVWKALLYVVLLNFGCTFRITWGIKNKQANKSPKIVPGPEARPSMSWE